MSVHRQEGEQCQDANKFRHNRRLRRVLRVVGGGKTEAHLVTDHGTGQIDGIENQAQGEADGKANQQLLGKNQQADTGRRFNTRHRRQGRRDSHGNRQAEDQPDTRGQPRIAEWWRRRQQRQDTRQRKKESGDPDIELGGGQGNHFLLA